VSESAIRAGLEELRAALRQRQLNREQAYNRLHREAIEGGRGPDRLSEVSHGGSEAAREEENK
jgi:hypothetical protein